MKNVKVGLVSCPDTRCAGELFAELCRSVDFGAYAFDMVDEVLYVQPGLDRFEMKAVRMYALGFIDGWEKQKRAAI